MKTKLSVKDKFTIIKENNRRLNNIPNKFENNFKKLKELLKNEKEN